MASINPPINIREIAPRCCATCKYMINLNGSAVCERDIKNDGDGSAYMTSDGEMSMYTTICDGYSKQ